MANDIVQKIQDNPKYRELVEARSRFGWLLTWIMFVAYYGYILIIAFDKEILAKKTGDGVMTLGIPVGFGLIVFTVILTGLYVWRANHKYDEMSAVLMREVK